MGATVSSGNKDMAISFYFTLSNTDSKQTCDLLFVGLIYYNSEGQSSLKVFRESCFIKRIIFIVGFPPSFELEVVH